jgi:hypothetical protein
MTTIQGVSILSRQKKHGHDVFELGLSQAGIEVRRPGQPVHQMSWERVSEWEIEESNGFVVLTLRGRGATTPLVVPGWTLDDLEVLMRDVTSDAATYKPDGPGPVVADGKARAGAARAATATPAPAPAPAPPAPRAAAPEPAPAPAPAPPAGERPPTLTRAERRQRADRRQRAERRAPGLVPWKVVATVVLLGALATAVIVVLLQSAGIIDWSFLGPVA